MHCKYKKMLQPTRMNKHKHFTTELWIYSWLIIWYNLYVLPTLFKVEQILKDCTQCYDALQLITINNKIMIIISLGCWLLRTQQSSKRLKGVGSQDALISSFNAPCVQHLLRCCPSTGHPALIDFDELLRSAVSLISNSVLSDDQWLQDY